MDYREYNDYELLSYIGESSPDASDILIGKYRPLIISIAKKFYAKSGKVGIELNDLIQEGMIGFSYAVNSYNENKDVLFYTYARTCIERRIITYIIHNNTQKYKALNESLSYDSLVDEKEVSNLLRDNTADPLSLVISKERKTELLNIASDKLSEYEFKVFKLKVDGFSYKKMALILNKDRKDIDNALQRIRTKLKDIGYLN